MISMICTGEDTLQLYMQSELDLEMCLCEKE